MPKMPPRPCTHSRCHSMAVSGGRCEDHKHAAWKSSEGKTPTERGYGYKWTKVRKQALKRDNYLCQECIRSNILTTATEVDHILSKAKGGDDSIGNLQSLCSACHSKKTVKERGNGNC